MNRPPERLAEVLLEILALSDSARTSQSESVSINDGNELADGHCVDDESQRSDEEDDNGQVP